MSAATYEVDSLEDMARAFEHCAGMADVDADHATTQKGRAARKAEANTWRAAAAMLRQTVLKPAEEAA